MKKYMKLSGIAFLACCLIIYSCRKDFSTFEEDQVPVSNEMLEVAKIFHESRATITESSIRNFEVKVLKLTKTPNRKKFIRLRPRWDKSFTLNASAGGELIIVPTFENKLATAKIEIRRFFIFKVKNHRISAGEIIEVIGTNYKLDGHLDKLLTEKDNNTSGDFNGSILRYDLNYFFKSGSVYENGVKVNKQTKIIDYAGIRNPAKVSKISSLDGGKATASDGIPLGGTTITGYGTNSYVMAGDCRMYFHETWQEDENGNRWNVHQTFLYSVGDCSGISHNPPPQPPDPDCSNCGTGTGTGTVTNPGGGGGGPYGGNPPQIDKTDITQKHPCWTKLISLELESIQGYEQFITPFMSSTSKPSINWKASSEMNWGGTSGYYDAAVTTDVYASLVSSNIILNSKMLDSASVLFIAATTIHETVHAYMKYNSYMGSPNTIDTSAPNYMKSWFEYYKFAFNPNDPNYVHHKLMLETQFDNMVTILHDFGNDNYTLNECRMALLSGMNNAGPNPTPQQTQWINQAYNSTMSRFQLTSSQVTEFNQTQFHAPVQKRLPNSCP